MNQVVIVLVLLGLPTTVLGAVAKGGAEYGGHCYYRLGTSCWKDAEAEAIKMGGHLVAVGDVAEQSWVFATFSDDPFCGLWIGLIDEASEGTWGPWTNGETSPYRNWDTAHGEPNNNLYVPAGEDFAHMFEASDNLGRGGLWNDSQDCPHQYDAPICGVVEVPAPCCGDKNVFGTEKCDDGNSDPDDGCNNCQYECAGLACDHVCGVDIVCSTAYKGKPTAEVICGTVGSSASDVIFGGGGSDTICGFGGSDTLRGDAGDDRLFGGPDADRLFGGPGNDKLFGGAQNDGLYGDTGNDCLDGGTEDDVIEGLGGADTLIGGLGADTLRGGPGDDVVSATDGTKDKIVAGGPGSNAIYRDAFDTYLPGTSDTVGVGTAPTTCP